MMPAAICIVAPAAQPKLMSRAVLGRAVSSTFEPSYGSIEGYVAAKTLVEGLRRAGSNASQEGLIAGLESLREFNVGGFFIDFSAQKHTGSKYVDMTILTADGRVRR